MATDKSILHHIQELVEEEHELRRQREEHHIDADAEVSRLSAVEVELDQAWDLLRQRRARHESGQDPDEASQRPPSTVEHYQQ